jgi:tetratricopeptide (TPR) repeat protein
MTPLPTRARVLAAAMAAAVSGVCSLAVADAGDREKARIEVARGAKLYEQGDFAAALVHFQAAHALFPSPKLFFNMALSYERLGKLAQALTFHRLFLQDPVDTKQDLVLASRRSANELAKKVGFVTITSDVPGLEVAIDGAPIGSTPIPVAVPVDVGHHEMVVRGRGLPPWARSFTSVPGLSVELKAEFTAGKTPGPLKGARREALPVGAQAGPIAAAEELVRKGVELRKQRKHLEAYDYFKRAFELSPTPRPMAQLGLVEYQLGRWVEAEIHLEEAAKSQSDPFIRQNRATIGEALEVVRSHIAFIAIRGTPPGAEVSVNGRVVGKLPLPGLVKASDGYAEVRFSAPGYVSAKRTLSLQPQLTQELFISLENQETGAGALASATPAGQVSLTPPADPRGGLVEANPERGKVTRLVGMLLGGTGLLAAAYGGYQTYRVRALSQQVRENDVQGLQRGRAAERLQWWGYGLGAGALGAGTVVYLLGRQDPAAVASLSLTSPSPGSILVGLWVLR